MGREEMGMGAFRRHWNNGDWSAIVVGAVCALLVGAVVYGYVTNIIVIAHSQFALVPIFILRCIGIFVPPLGVILGFIS